MASITVIYTTGNENTKTSLPGLLTDQGHIEQEVEIPSTTFCIAYKSEINKSIFDADVSQRINNANSVCVICLSTTENPADISRLVGKNENIICVEPNVNWQNIKYLKRMSEKHSRFLEDLRAVENKCMSVDDRNSIRRQHFQQEYEYLQEEIDQLEHAMKGVAIVESDAVLDNQAGIRHSGNP